jgi:hypothetical protein
VATLTLVSQSLLSKWGFNDGDTPDAVLDYCDKHGLNYGEKDWRDEVLPHLVRTYLLPELQKHHTITLIEIGTSHNPIRASLVDGKDVEDEWTEDTTTGLTPEWGEVPMTEVIKAMRAQRIQP